MGFFRVLRFWEVLLHVLLLDLVGSKEERCSFPSSFTTRDVLRRGLGTPISCVSVEEMELLPDSRPEGDECH